MAELHERREEWQPPPLPEGIPENFRLLLTTRPPPPAAPTDFEPWPFRTWRTEVLRRAEFITEGTDAGPTFGNDPAMQAAARPGFVPGDASAFCEVEAGLLFTDEQGRRLLLAVDWMPLNMMVTDDEARIEAYLADCESVEMGTYIQRQTSSN